MNLYEITQEYLEAFAALEIDEETGELVNAEAIEQIAGAFESKAEAVALYIKNELAMADAIKTEERTLADRRKIHENKADGLKRYLGDSMQALGKTKVETSKVRLAFRKSIAVEVYDEQLIPAEYVRIKTETTPDKKALADALKQGADIAGAALVERQSLQVK